MKCLWAIVLVLPLTAAAQKKEQAYVDSLLQVLRTAKEDTSKADLLSRISFSYQSLDPAEGIRHGEDGFALAEKLGWKKGMARANNSIGVNYKARSDYPKALEYFLAALKLNEDIRDTTGIAQNSGNIGIVYKTLGDYTNAMKYYGQALSLYEKLGDQKGIAINLGNIGILYNTQKQYAKALEYELKALETWKAIGNKKSVALWLGNIGIVYGDSGEYKVALGYAQEALAINESTGNKKGMVDNYRSLGSFYYGMAKDEATAPGKANLLHLADVNLLEALDIAAGLGDLRNLQEINDILSKVHELGGNHDRALKHYKEYVLYKDSIFSMDSKKMIAGLEAKREAELNKKEIEMLNKQRELDQERSRRTTIYFITGLGALVVVSVLLLSLYRVKQRSNVQLKRALENLKETQQQLVQQEKLASLGQMTAAIAHEIKNPLNFVINFSSLSRDLVGELETATPGEQREIIAMLKENLAKIEHHSSRSDQVVKAMLMHSRTGSAERVPTDINALCKEMMSLAAHSSKLEDPGFSFTMDSSFSPALPALRIVPQEISRVILNLLDNAIYAVKQEGTTPKITLSTQRSGDAALIVIKDNGPGIPVADREKIFQPFFTTKPSGKGTGLGLSISYDIVKAHGGEIRINAPAEGGTEFIVELPVKE